MIHPRPTAETVGLGTRSARGMVYLFASSTASKFITLAAQFILSYLLSEKDYGVVGLALMFSAFIQVIEQSGVGDLLVQRRLYRAWAIPGFWLALALGLVSCVLIVLAAPLAAAAFDNDQLLWVLIVLAPSSIANSLMVVPKAQLVRQLRFRALAAINLVNLAARMVLTVVLALLGLGPFSWIVPMPVTAALLAAFLWWWVRPPWSPRPHFRRWKYLLGDSTRLLFAEYGMVLLGWTDYLFLGAYRSIQEVGIYMFGYLFSVQMIQLFSMNLTNILFPALTRLNDRPEAKIQGFLNAQRILAMIGIAMCLLQAAIAEPLTRLFLDPKWIPAIAVMQVLCLGMATRMVAGSSFAFMKSQGHFHEIGRIRWIFVAIQMAALWIALAAGGGVVSVALVVAVVSTLIGAVTFYAAIRPCGGGWSQVAAVLVPPVVSGGIAVGTGWLVAQALSRLGFGQLVQLVEIIVVAVGLGMLLARTFMRPVWNDLWARAWRILPARSAA